MNKGLEALTYFKTLFEIWKDKIAISNEIKEDEEEYGFKPRYELIEKELKALEIIKEKKVDADILYQSVDYMVYNEKTRHCFYKKPLTLEEWCLLKEVLL